MYSGACSAGHCLGNVLMFYGQFKDAVEKALQGLVAPIEKEFSVRSILLVQYVAY